MNAYSGTSQYPKINNVTEEILLFDIHTYLKEKNIIIDAISATDETEYPTM